MKSYIAILIILSMDVVSSFASATIRLNNKDSKIPILPANIPWVTGDVYVEVLGGPGTSFASVYQEGTGLTVFKVDKQGFFDAGIGIIPGVSGGTEVDLKLRVWYGPGSFFGSSVRGESIVWSQVCGDWIPSKGFAPTGSVLRLPSSPIFELTTIPNVVSPTLGKVSGSLVLTNVQIKAAIPKKAK